MIDAAIHNFAPGRGWVPRLVVGVWLATFATGFFYALVQPVWSVVDEGPHFGYVELVAESGEFPSAGETLVSERVLAVGRDRQWGWQYPRDLSLRVDRGGEIPLGGDGGDESQWVRENLWRFNYEAIQPPAYYMASAIVYRVVPGGTLSKVYALRVFAAFIASLNVLVAYRIARRISPRSRILQIGAPASFLVLQGYMLNLSQVTNDAAAATMGGLMLLLLVEAYQEGVDRRGALVLGAALGIALLTKSVLWVYPLLCVVVLLKRYGVRVGVRKLRPVVIVSALIFVPWLVRNFLVYGEATGQSRMSRLLGAFFPAPDLAGLGSIWGYAWGSSRHMVLSYAWGEPVWVWAYGRLNSLAVYLLLALCALGWVRYRVQVRRMGHVASHPSARVRVRTLVKSSGPGAMRVPLVAPTLERSGMWICAAAIGIAYASLMVLPLLGGLAVVGRYMYPESAGIAVAGVFGVARAFPRPRMRSVALAAIAAGFVVLNIVNLLGWGATGLATSKVADGIATTTGSSAPATTWYFAGGRNEGGFTENIVIFNPNLAPATAALRYYPGGGTVGRRTVDIAPGATLTVNTRLDRGGGYGAGHLVLGASVESDLPVVVERSVYFYVTDRGWTGGTVGPGQIDLRQQGWFAAGRVGGGVAEAISLLNPGDADAAVTLTYLVDGSEEERRVRVPKRSPVWVEIASNKAGGLGRQAERVSVRVDSDRPIAMERQMFYSLAGSTGGDFTLASTPGASWTFPAVRSGAGYHPTLVLWNPDEESARGSLVYHLGSEIVRREVTLPPGRHDIDLNVATGAGLGVTGQTYALTVDFDKGVVAELETLVRDGGITDATVQPGVSAPSNRRYFATASTMLDFDQRLTLFNPEAHDVWVTVRYGSSRPSFLPVQDIEPVEKSLRLLPGEVLDLDVRNHPGGVGSAQEASISVESSDAIFTSATLSFIHNF